MYYSDPWADAKFPGPGPKPRKPEGEIYQVWTLAERDGEGVVGGVFMGSAFANSWEKACRIVMETHNDSYWNPEQPTRYWGQPLCKSHAEARRFIKGDT
jgi:hypothetical protein